jgi:hypothetical protein
MELAALVVRRLAVSPPAPVAEAQLVGLLGKQLGRMPQALAQAAQV